MIDIALEVMDESLIGEMTPLLDAHTAELNDDRYIEYNPNWGVYLEMQESGSFKIFTAREEGALVGYVSYFIFPHIHYDRITAQSDAIFLEKRFRGKFLAKEMRKFAEEHLKECGVDDIYQVVKCSNDYSAYLYREGYEDYEKTLVKRIQS